LEQVTSLPTFPIILQRLRDAVNDPASDAKQIERILRDDPAMTARILKVVNSAFYGTFDPISSVRLAVARLGMAAVNNIALATAVFNLMPSKDDNCIHRTSFWKHSIGTGVAAAILLSRARMAGTPRLTPDMLHTAGILHDIGKVVLDLYFKEGFSQAILKAAHGKIPLVEAEKHCIGASHAEVGAWLAGKWRLSVDLTCSIEWHHDPAQAPQAQRFLVALIHAADRLCMQAGIGDVSDAYAVSTGTSVLSGLGIAEPDGANILETIATDVPRSPVFTSLSLVAADSR
jgi:putative nucleotidyltransferase with HDIG domain